MTFVLNDSLLDYLMKNKASPWLHPFNEAMLSVDLISPFVIYPIALAVSIIVLFDIQVIKKPGIEREKQCWG